jgi:hypothetical protein
VVYTVSVSGVANFSGPGGSEFPGGSGWGWGSGVGAGVGVDACDRDAVGEERLIAELEVLELGLAPACLHSNSR